MGFGTRIKDEWRESQLFTSRAVVAGLIAIGLVVTLVLRLAWLQIQSHEHYVTLSEGNRVRLEPVPPTRGLIYDRNGVLLAENLPNYQLEIVPEQVEDLDRLLDELAGIVAIRPADRERFDRLLKTQRRFQPIPLRYNLSDREVARLALNRYRFPGVDIRARLTRNYPFGDTLAHALGYVGAINEEELRQLDPATYAGTTHVGKTGIELRYESLLHGTPGYRQVEVNAQGRPVRVLDVEPPVPGSDLYLNIDIRLQRIAEQALGDFKGAVVAMDPRNGEVLALVSRPAFNPNLFVEGISQADYAALRNDPRQPMFNRFLNGHYPPGSTIKPMLALGAMQQGIDFINQTAFCTGEFMLEGHPRPFRCWKREGHGRIDVHDAIAQSCDVFFYELAVKMGIDGIHDFLARFGLGKPTGIDLVGEFSGLLPSREWKRRARNEIWYPGETVITGIGQGFMLTTPLQLAQATAVLAMRGKTYRPQILQAHRNHQTGTPEFATTEAFPRVELRSSRYWQRISNAMHDVVQGEHGTARGSGWDAKYDFAGKTGTAQVFTLEKGEEYEFEELAVQLRDHGLFIAFAPLDDPRIAVSVVVENGGGGSAVAAPVARRVLDAWLLELAPAARSTEGGTP